MMFGWPDVSIAAAFGFLLGVLVTRMSQQPPRNPPPVNDHDLDRDYWWQRGEDPPGYGD